MRTENIGFGDLRLIQDPEQFCFGVDAVILADFASKIMPSFRTAADLGTGTGIVPFILSSRSDSALIAGLDVQEPSIRMAEESCSLNGLTDRLEFIRRDINDVLDKDMRREMFSQRMRDALSSGGGFDMVTSNPPYVPRGSGIQNGSGPKFIARQETTADLETFIRAAGALLRHRGSFFMVHRPSRLPDIMHYGRVHGLEPKTMRMVAPRAGEAANIVLVHFVKGGGRELKVMNELYVYDGHGDYTDEIECIYERK